MVESAAVEARVILERSGLAPSEYTAFFNAVQASLTSDSAALELRLTEEQRQAWVDVFTAFSRSLEQKSTEAVEPSGPVSYPIRMKRKEYLAIKRLVLERRLARDSANQTGLKPANDGEGEDQPNARSSGSSSSGFSLDALDSSALQELAQSDGLVIVKTKLG
jgi:hypothetical protein